MKRILLIGLLGVVLTGCGKDNTCPDTEKSVRKQALDKVKSTLQLPSTATFPNSDKNGLIEIGEKDGICHYYIEGDVDAENSFGGIVRSHFSMNLEYNMSTEKWNFENFELK